MRRKRKFDAIRLINRALDKGYRALDRAVEPSRRPRKGRGFFDLFMDEVTGAPKRRRW